MRILLLGPNGQVGWELRRALAPLGNLTALDRHARQGLCGDLTRTDELARTVQSIQPDVIVNAAAYTDVDKAESEPGPAELVNAHAPGVLAREAQKSGALLVHYSTDYVFDGSGVEPWSEVDAPAPVNVYGSTKLSGERAIMESGCRHIIFRSSWVYAARGKSFLHAILRLAGERSSLEIVNDQYGAPTGAELIADITSHAILRARNDRGVGGVLHLAAGGETTWYGYARYVVDQARKAGWRLNVEIKGVPTEAYPTPAQRPKNSRLNCDRLEHLLGLQSPRWEEGVQRALMEIPLPSIDNG